MTPTPDLPDRFRVMPHPEYGAGVFDMHFGEWVRESFTWHQDVLPEPEMFRRLRAVGYPAQQWRLALRERRERRAA